MSIINSLKTFSKKAFNVEPKGSNIDEVLDDMASKVTPGSGGVSGSDDVMIFNVVPISEDNGQTSYLEINATINEIEEALIDHVVLFCIKRAHIPGDPYIASDNDKSEIIEAYSFNRLDYDSRDLVYRLLILNIADESKTITFNTLSSSKDERPIHDIK